MNCIINKPMGQIRQMIYSSLGNMGSSGKWCGRAVKVDGGDGTLCWYPCSQNGNAVQEWAGSWWPVITVDGS